MHNWMMKHYWNDDDGAIQVLRNAMMGGWVSNFQTKMCYEGQGVLFNVSVWEWVVVKFPEKNVT